MTDDTTLSEKSNPHVFLLAGEAEGGPGLRAARCEACGSHTIGRVPVCAHCFSRNVLEVAAGHRAQLIEHSMAHVPAGGFDAPYAIGQVRTEEGLTLFAPLVGDLEGLTSGAPLDFVTVDNGAGQVGFAYQYERGKGRA